jgi:hypothetical protein
VQLNGIHTPAGLRTWSPARYGTLDVTDGGTLNGDELAWDILTQAARAAIHPVSARMLGGLLPERLIAAGTSQSADRLGAYYNFVEPGVFDGYVLTAANPVVRDDLGVPVMKVHTETDAAFIAWGVPFPPSPPLQADSDTLRTWQVAGSSHVDAEFTSNLRTIAARDGIPIPQPGLCDVQEETSRVRFHHVTNAAYDRMAEWIVTGSPPSMAPPILTAGSAIVRDARGLALGGIRLADHGVPTALNTGLNSGPFFCFLAGAHQRFDESELRARYPTHGAYVEAVQAVARANLADGFITLSDMQETIAGAAGSGIGR